MKSIGPSHLLLLFPFSRVNTIPTPPIRDKLGVSRDLHGHQNKNRFNTLDRFRILVLTSNPETLMYTSSAIHSLRAHESITSNSTKTQKTNKTGPNLAGFTIRSPKGKVTTLAPDGSLLPVIGPLQFCPRSNFSMYFHKFVEIELPIKLILHKMLHTQLSQLSW
jgi:hypothetical protein